MSPNSRGLGRAALSAPARLIKESAGAMDAMVRRNNNAKSECFGFPFITRLFGRAPRLVNPAEFYFTLMMKFTEAFFGLVSSPFLISDLVLFFFTPRISIDTELLLVSIFEEESGT